MDRIHNLLETALTSGASDLILKVGTPPVLRVDGTIQKIETPPLDTQDMQAIAYGIIYCTLRDFLIQNPDADIPDPDSEADSAERWMKELRNSNELDLVFTIPRRARVRANLFLQRGVISAVLHLIPLFPPTLEELHLPAMLKEVALLTQGLIVIAGPTGSGRTSTLAALIEEINRCQHRHIFLMESAAEYLFNDKQSVIQQREFGKDTRNLTTALQSVLQLSPDVIALGGTQDRETLEFALNAAESGHLVLTLVHAGSAVSALDRIINAFPDRLQPQITSQLSANLLCAVSQRLVPCATGSGRVPAVEVLTSSPLVRKHIESGARDDLYSVIRDGQHYGMQTLSQSLAALVQSGDITRETAHQYTSNASEIEALLTRTAQAS